MISPTEENYLKAIFALSEKTDETVSTNAIAAAMNTSAASVTDMLKRLTEKGYTIYEKYKGVVLSEDGERIATQLLRKHRLWETFMVEKLQFTWDEVHPVAEQLEHIQSEELIDRLEHFLGYPQFDPHGDPIPNKDGKFTYRRQIPLSEIAIGKTGTIVGVRDHTPSFLRYVEQLRLTLGATIQVLEQFEYDLSLRLLVNGAFEQIVSHKVSQNLYVNPGEK